MMCGGVFGASCLYWGRMSEPSCRTCEENTAKREPGEDFIASIKPVSLLSRTNTHDIPDGSGSTKTELEDYGRIEEHCNISDHNETISIPSSSQTLITHNSKYNLVWLASYYSMSQERDWGTRELSNFYSTNIDYFGTSIVLDTGQIAMKETAWFLFLERIQWTNQDDTKL